MKKNILIIISVIIFAPSIALASWWNPISWFNNWSFKKVDVSQQIQTSNQQISDQKIIELQKQVEELKRQPILSTSNLKTLETNIKDQTNNNIITQIPNKIETKESIKADTDKETVTKEYKSQDSFRQNNSINYSSLIDFSSIPSADINKYVTLASKKTGVPSDLLLSILNNNNPNKSTCYVNYSKTNTLKASAIISKNDLLAFNTIAYNLDLNSDEIAVSCDGTIGFGFVPRTWIGISQLGKDKNINLLNPWNPEDVVMEIALVLGANGGSYTKNLLTGEFNQTLACKSTIWCK
jgi:hypothetical protein